jgi:hypothetical protein
MNAIPNTPATEGPAAISAAAEEAPVARTAEIQGLVDNVTADRLYGWAWNAASPGERLSIELRIRDEPVAQGVADRMRPDLARAGIGDGRHAFEIPLHGDWAKQVADMVVLARTAEGGEAPLAIRLRRAELDPNGNLQRVLEATAAAHRQMREELERISARLPPEDTTREPLLRALAEGQAELNGRLDGLSVWLARLDEKLAVLPSQDVSPLPPRRLDAWQFVLAVVLAAVLAGAGLATAGHLLPFVVSPGG